MRRIYVSKATNADETLELVINQDIPQFQGGSIALARTNGYFRGEAEEIAEALHKALPGGLFWRLTLAMMDRHINVLHVADVAIERRAEIEAEQAA